MAEIAKDAAGFTGAINEAHAAVRCENCQAFEVELGMKMNTINELTARIAELDQRLNDRRILLTAEIAAELAGKTKIDATGKYMLNDKGFFVCFTIAEAEKQALELYEFFEKHFGK